MTEVFPLSLERCWTVPPRNITYLEDGIICAEFRNNSDDSIEIDEVACRFQTEPNLTPYQVSVSPMLRLKPRWLSRPPVQLSFVAGLTLTSYTNTYQLIVKYTRSGVSKTATYPPPSYLIVRPLGPPEKEFFVSHKDPEDSPIAERLDHYLKKVGFRG